MEKLENLKSEFQRYVDSKKWNRFMEEKSVNTFRRLVELEEKHNKSIVDIDNKYIAENAKRLSYQAIMQEMYMINQVFEFIGSNKRLAITDFNKDMLKVNTNRFYTKEELQNVCESLINPQDKILLYGLFAGLRGVAYKELLELKVKDINLILEHKARVLNCLKKNKRINGRSRSVGNYAKVGSYVSNSKKHNKNAYDDFFAYEICKRDSRIIPLNLIL